jgi:DNA-directed RNA polymerase subunit RPC12/RpoP
MLPTHDVACPECGKFVYTALSLEDVVPADAPSGPKILFDKDGPFLTCPHCRARIAMTQVQTRGGPAFRIAPKQ